VKDGSLWYYEDKETAKKNLVVSKNRPSVDLNARKATINLNGFTFRLGIKFSF